MTDENTEKKKCTKCKVFRLINQYKEGRTQCNKCLDQKQKYRENHREELKEKAKEYYENNKDKIAENKKQYRQQMVECKNCQMMIQKCKLTRHEKTKKHLYNVSNPDNTKLTKNKVEEKLEKEKATKKETDRLEHQKVIQHLNDTFPSYPSEEF